MEDSDLLTEILDSLDTAYTGSTEPPPHFEAALGAPGPTGIHGDRIAGWRRGLVAEVTGTLTFGVILRGRREAMDIDLGDLAHEARWAPARVEELEDGSLDLNLVEPEVLARLMLALRVEAIGAIEEPLRKLAWQHLAVYQHGAQVYGRSRKGVTAVDRRRDLTTGVMPVDTAATERVVVRYLAAVQRALHELRT
jgi:hypothetical protein